MNVIAVTGGRDFLNWRKANEVLDSLHKKTPIDVLVHGDADGADDICRGWAVYNCVQLCEWPVTGRQWTKVGKSSGPRRNGLMLKVTRPNILVAFPGGDGTADCVQQARALSIEVLEVSDP